MKYLIIILLFGCSKEASKPHLVVGTVESSGLYIKESSATKWHVFSADGVFGIYDTTKDTIK